MTLVWRCPPPPVATRWRGLDVATRAQLARNPFMPIAAIVGPPGRDGEAQLPPVIDGGNF